MEPSADELIGVSCLPPACTVVGVQGTCATGGGPTLALRGKDGHFTRQRTPNPPVGQG
ncbi:MAG TPA: hypothetical protein VGQ05_15465 [Streptosporangiaceae bacterium]|nr:hypothetical protein [Streptosporangiaceae bacterium]